MVDFRTDPSATGHWRMATPAGRRHVDHGRRRGQAGMVPGYELQAQLLTNSAWTIELYDRCRAARSSTRVRTPWW